MAGYSHTDIQRSDYPVWINTISGCKVFANPCQGKSHCRRRQMNQNNGIKIRRLYSVSFVKRCCGVFLGYLILSLSQCAVLDLAAHERTSQDTQVIQIRATQVLIFLVIC